jgi:hypothetical protein
VTSTIRWMPWGAEAFARCRAEGKPLLLSLTARWCHACHRMDDETWEDPGVVALVERAAVPLRVDADARPDVSARYHLGGLPTTALLDEQGGFIRGGTYFSAFELLRFLDLALEDWRSGRRPDRRATPKLGAPESLVDEVAGRLLRRADAQHGGFGIAPKLAEADALTVLLRRWRASREPAIERVVRASLDAIVAHLSDPVDGGFFRYAAAPDWTGAHTEKVSLDQGQIARVLLEAGAAMAEPRYVAAARAGLVHARRRLADRAGRIFASVAAAPEYYAAGNSADRADRAKPEMDRRRFADGAASIALAAALARALTGDDLGFRPEFREQAPSGVVPHRLDRREGPCGLLRDQALAILATLVEYRLTGDRERLDWSQRAAEWVLATLWDEDRVAFRAEPPPPAGEARLPAMFPLIANGEMALALADLADLTRHAEYRRAAERVVASLGGDAIRSPAAATLALAGQRLDQSVPEADLTGDPADPGAQALVRAAMAALGPTAVIRWTGPGAPRLALCADDGCLLSIAEPRALLEALVDQGRVPRGILGLWLSSIPRSADRSKEASR